MSNQVWQNPGIVFPHGSQLQVRCKQLGLYKLLGTANPRCQNGNWTTRLPSCVPTTLLTNFTGAFTSFKNRSVFNELKIAEDSPPTILIKIPSGSASMEPGGELAVFPGSTLHLECLYPRRVGSPDWTWTTPSGQYRTGMFQLHTGISPKPSTIVRETVVLALNLFRLGNGTRGTRLEVPFINLLC